MNVLNGTNVGTINGLWYQRWYFKVPGNGGKGLGSFAKDSSSHSRNTVQLFHRVLSRAMPLRILNVDGGSMAVEVSMVV